MSSSATAETFFAIVPQVMRVITADLRRSSLEVDPIHVHLLGLLREGDRSLGELAEVFSVSPPTMSKTVSTLEARGWVVRERSETDRRIVRVHLSSAGHSVLAEARAYAESQLAEVLAPLSAADRERLHTGLLVLGEAFSDALPEGPDDRHSARSPAVDER